jgi:hypothetical protein
MRSEPVDKGNELRQAQLSIYLLCDLAGGCIGSLISKLLLYSLRGRGIPIDHRHNDRITFRPSHGASAAAGGGVRLRTWLFLL